METRVGRSRANDFANALRGRLPGDQLNGPTRKNQANVG